MFSLDFKGKNNHILIILLKITNDGVLEGENYEQLLYKLNQTSEVLLNNKKKQ